MFNILRTCQRKAFLEIKKKNSAHTHTHNKIEVLNEILSACLRNKSCSAL